MGVKVSHNQLPSPGSVQMFLSHLFPPLPLRCRHWQVLWPSLGVRDSAFPLPQTLDSFIFLSSAGPVSSGEITFLTLLPLPSLLPSLASRPLQSLSLASIHYPLSSHLPFASSARMEALCGQKMCSFCPSPWPLLYSKVSHSSYQQHIPYALNPEGNRTSEPQGMRK